MVYIAHRGNTNGKFESYENEPMYIDKAISEGFDVEVDVWMVEGILFLGHDEPQYGVIQHWFNERYNRLWIHCKNVEAMEWFNMIGGFKYFWHTTDNYTLISNGMVLVKPGEKLIENSICCMPEMGYIGDITKCYAIMTDDIGKYKID
jgi:hypothetical protein